MSGIFINLCQEEQAEASNRPKSDLADLQEWIGLPQAPPCWKTCLPLQISYALTFSIRSSFSCSVLLLNAIFITAIYVSMGCVSRWIQLRDKQYKVFDTL
ncbi:hypothetical protein GDO78_017455 [Eleutherodactylus coqui]|uniref:Uncharacterized protein n=1 Tax=Eleutherodactylus coqui TaxID=57060 RepID=A0A8J6ENS6_ELECQ|nr:hypothetical protein GDO78_017455 [Eleutherodactylus coqui]